MSTPTTDPAVPTPEESSGVIPRPDPSVPDNWFDEGADLPAAVGVVPTTGRGSLPFSLLHGEPLLVVSSWALEEAGVALVDFNAPWEDLQAWARPLVLHDPLCPMTPPDFLVQVASLAAESTDPIVVVGSRPVTDTVKEVEDDEVGETVDRDTLVAVTSPVVLSAAAVAALEGWPDLDDLPGLVDRLRGRFEVRYVEAPEQGRRIVDESDLELLRSATNP